MQKVLVAKKYGKFICDKQGRNLKRQWRRDRVFGHGPSTPSIHFIKRSHIVINPLQGNEIQ